MCQRIIYLPSYGDSNMQRYLELNMNLMSSFQTRETSA